LDQCRAVPGNSSARLSPCPEPTATWQEAWLGPLRRLFRRYWLSYVFFPLFLGADLRPAYRHKSQGLRFCGPWPAMSVHQIASVTRAIFIWAIFICSIPSEVNVSKAPRRV